MRFFLTEYLTSGASGAPPDAKADLGAEGAAMLRALASDAVAIPDAKVSILWDADLPPFDVVGVTVLRPQNPLQERMLFESQLAKTDFAHVIAPEFQNLLAERCVRIAASNCRSSNCSETAVRLCADKLALYEHLQAAKIPTIPTAAWDLTSSWTRPFQGLGWLIKPRLGAGSLNIFWVQRPEQLAEARLAFLDLPAFGEPIVQPFLLGQPLSVAAIVGPSQIEIFPPAEQHLHLGSNLRYLGGRVPYSSGWEPELRELVRSTLNSIPGLLGYVGVDLLLPEPGSLPRGPVVVEVNPRLTTSYLGYRRLTHENLAARILDPTQERAPVVWEKTSHQFFADGRVIDAGPPNVETD